MSGTTKRVWILAVLCLTTTVVWALERKEDSLRSLIVNPQIPIETRTDAGIAWVDELLRQYELDSAKKYIDWTLRETRKADNKVGEGNAEMRLASYWRRNGESDSAFLHYGLAANIRLGQNDLAGAASAYNGQAIVNKNRQFYELALQQGLLAKKMLEEAKDATRLAQTCLTLSELYRLIGDYGKALEELHQGVKFIPKTNDLLLGKLSNQLGIVHYDYDQFDSAQHYHEQALALRKEQGRPGLLATTWNNLGLVALEKKEWEKAEEYLHLAETFYLEANWWPELGGIWLNKARLALQTENHEEALNWLRQADSLLEIPEERKRMWEHYFSTYLALNQHDSALYAYQQKDSIGDVLFNEKRSNQLAEIQEKYESEKKDRQLQFQELELNKQAQEKRVLYFIILGVVLLLLVALLVVRLFQRDAHNQRLLREKEVQEVQSREELVKVNALLEGQEKERERVGRDLHDRVGSLLSTVKLHFTSLEIKQNVVRKESQDHYQKTSAMLDEAVEEVRKISHDLVSGVLVNFGLPAALQDLAQSVSETGQIQMDVVLHQMEDRLPGNLELQVYRVVQELLTNAQRHGKANRFQVNLQKIEGRLTLVADDNGSGFNPEEVSEGIGIRNMRNRLEPIGGSIKFDSHPKRGTTAIVEVPISKAGNLD